MAIPTKSDSTFIDTLPGEETEFTIGDARWVMRSLADLYSNRELAIIREYSTNARDAMDEAGKLDEPILVTLPGEWNQNLFTVKDHGIGMSTTELQEVYTVFGDSTKRKSNTTSGMLGFGCKSALAYTDQFTIISVKNGLRTVGVIIKKPDFSIVLKIVDTSMTDEPNGTEVNISIQNPSSFNAVAKDFYRFWQPGKVLVNQREPERAIGKKINDNLYYSTLGSNASYVVMGSVPYRIENPSALFTNSMMSRTSFVIFVENGAVEFTPNREALKYSDLTKNSLKKVIADYEKSIKEQAKKEILSMKTAPEALKCWISWNKTLGEHLFRDMEFEGNKFVSHVPAVGFRFRVQTNLYQRSKYGTHSYIYGDYSIDLLHQSMIVYNCDVNISTALRKRCVDYKQNINSDKTDFLFVKDEKFSNYWIDDKNVISFEEFKKLTTPSKNPKQARAPRVSRQSNTFDIWTKDGAFREKPLPTKGNIYTITPWERDRVSSLSGLLTLIDESGTIVLLSRNRLDKFKRDHPKSKSFMKVAEDFVILDGTTLINEDTRVAMETSGDVASVVMNLDISRINDPVIKKIGEALSKRDTSLYEMHRNLARSLGMFGKFKMHGINNNKTHGILDRYPLLKFFYGEMRNCDDIYIYINAAYEQKKETK